jgi:PAS domain S-box-containing protein
VDFLSLSLNDVTQRVQAEEGKARLSEIIEATSDFVGTADLEGRLLYINRAGRQMLGLDVTEDLSSMRVVDCHPPDTGRFIMNEALPAARRDGSWRGENLFLGRDGRVIPTSQVILVHLGGEGKEAFYSTVARDIRDLKQAEEKLKQLTSQLLKAQEEERRRLARELHDDLGQSLLVLKLQARTIERRLPHGQLQEDCGRAVKYIDEIIESVRRLSRDLSPSLLEDLGLSAALKYLFAEFRRHHESLIFLVEIEPLDRYLSQEVQVNIFRIFQEALTNIAKHARASQVKVGLKKEGDKLLGLVEDDGEGFAVSEILTKGGSERGLGLATMEERIRTMGGSLHIASEKGGGTKIAFHAPLDKDA